MSCSLDETIKVWPQKIVKNKNDQITFKYKQK